ncbi:DEAD/DEAH box helicase, partial [Roseovarius sp.]|uniref:DEAD/DEAH box helicase n=1 Tax=Roseovarius sp. TaxID=1486281 RepID=UPI0035669DEF
MTDLEVFGFGMGDDDILTILNGTKENPGGMKEKRVAVIEAGTGTGKSTFMPFRLMSPPEGAAFRPADAGQIVVTEPRRQATKDVARFVGEALVFGHDSRTCKAHIGPGFPVGYQVSGDRHWDSACDLIYVTDGTMINWVRDGSLARIGLVIVDEAHERSANIDIILAQLREKIHEYPHLRVMITSATIDRDFFIDYFGGPSQVFHHFIPEKKSFGYGVPLFLGLDVDKSLIRKGLTLERDVEPITFPGWSGFGPEHPGFPPDDLALETANYAKLRRGKEIPKERWSIEMPRALAEQVVAIAEATEFGDILGFLPTSRLIQQAIQNIERRIQKLGLDVDVYPLLSSTEKDKQDMATAARQRGEKRKIVISSNLAETSLTVSGVRYVVDSGLICRSEWDADIASGGLPVLPHSQAGLRQRWGRVGRDAPGWVFPLYTAEQFLSLSRDTPPESTRTNLEEFCTRLISSGLDPEKAVLPGNFEGTGYKPDEFARNSSKTFSKELQRAHDMLRAGGLVDADGDLTDLGREIERYSGSASEALAIALGDRLACLQEVALAITIVVRGNLYGQKSSILGTRREWPPEWRLRANACHRALAAGCKDDLDLSLRIASLYDAAEDGGQWCRTWWVNRDALDAALKEVEDAIKTLSAAVKKAVPRRPFKPALLARVRAALAHAFGEHVYRKEEDGSFTALADEVAANAPSLMLVPPQASVLAFQRRQTRNNDDEVDRKISHFVGYEDQGIGADRGNMLSDFDILLKLAERGGRRGGSESATTDPLTDARDKLPVGSVMRFDLEQVADGLAQIKAFKPLRDPFLPSQKHISSNARDNDSDDDPESDRDSGNADASDNEETGWQILDPRDEELNDEALGEIEPLPAQACPSPATAPPVLFARLAFGGEGLEAERAYTVADYAVEEGRCIVLLEPFHEKRRRVDPACHDAFRPLDEIKLEFLDA